MKWSITGTGKQSGLYIIDDFLTDQECEKIIRYGKKHGLVGSSFGLKGEVKERQLGATLHLDDNPSFKPIIDRLSRLSGFPVENGEKIAILSYGRGGEINYHNDYVPNKKQYFSTRVAQVLLYLNDVEEGGETGFLNMGIKIVPKKGRAVLWYGVQGMSPPKNGKKATLPKALRVNDYAVHSPLPVLSDKNKWVAILQIHKARYVSFDKVVVIFEGKEYTVSKEVGEAIEKMMYKFIPLDKGQVSEKEKKSAPSLEIILYNSKRMDISIKLVALRKNELIFSHANYPHLYCQDTSKGQFKKLLQHVLENGGNNENIFKK